MYARPLLAASFPRPISPLPLAVRYFSIASLILSWAPASRADLWNTLFPHEIDVITVTDMTDAGRVYPNATPAKPVYYMIIDLGERNFGRAWAGEKIPKSREARKWMMAAMAEQNYRLADDLHPPTQLFVYGWGMLQGGPARPALKFLGGDKADLMWEQEQYGGFVNSRVFLRNLQRVGVVGRVWDIAESDLFLGIVRSYTMASLKAGKPVLLWETRFGCPATGLAMKDAMPLMIKAAALNLGRETKMPVNLNASDEFGGHVDLGELKVVGTEPAKESDHPANEPAPAAPTDSR